ncbi:MAG: AAA family ATPase [Planctomycetes bacterium]|nr:AAA family ATPase [Planctomycetota bacterium]MCB9872003.1 AAA family ATPase [Planctomycetota bacterium]MCB9888407.1 AAA family ATPase [Planctomycetota bacterium]
MNDHQAASLSTTPDPEAPSTPWIAVTGGKGGVGKTVVATNLAIGIARAGHRVLLVDLDPGLANVDVHLRIAPRFDLEDLAEGACSAAQAIVAAPGGIEVLCGRSGSTRLAEEPGFLARALDAIAVAAESFDVVVCDTGAGIGRPVTDTAARCASLLAVTTPDPAAITDTYALCKLLATRGIRLPGILVNRVRDRDEAMRAATKLTTVAERFLGNRVALAGWIHEERALELSVRNQRPFSLAGSGQALDDMRALAAKTLSTIPASARRLGRQRDSLRRLLPRPGQRPALGTPA